VKITKENQLKKGNYYLLKKFAENDAFNNRGFEWDHEIGSLYKCIDVPKFDCPRFIKVSCNERVNFADGYEFIKAFKDL